MSASDSKAEPVALYINKDRLALMLREPGRGVFVYAEPQRGDDVSLYPSATEQEIATAWEAIKEYAYEAGADRDAPIAWAKVDAALNRLGRKE